MCTNRHTGLELKSLTVATLEGSLHGPDNAAQWGSISKVKNNSSSSFSDEGEQECFSAESAW